MPLTKRVDCDSFFKNDEQTVTIIDFESIKGGGLVKVASADDRITEYASKIVPDSDKIYVHILAMGSGEYYGANKNADIFYEDILEKYHESFVTTPAHVFRLHQNKDPAKAIGQVIYSIYNPRMRRVELVAWICKVKGADVVERLNNGDFPKTSMATRTPYDTCSICRNKARTRMEYCSHLTDELGRIYPDGRRVMAINDAPLTFFDISLVHRPADVTSSILQKLASAESETIVGSAEIAEDEGLDKVAVVVKKSTLRKISEMVKEVDGEVAQNLSHINPILAGAIDPKHILVSSLKGFKLEDTLETMAHMGISPSIAFLAELIIAKQFDSKLGGLGEVVESMVHEMGAGPFNIPEDICAADCPRKDIANLLSGELEGCSMLPEFVEKRASSSGYGRFNSNIGYIGNGPMPEPTPYEQFKEVNGVTEVNEQAQLAKLLKTLLEIGGGAIAAKMYINRAIDQKVKESMMGQGNTSNPQVKIILVKSASEYATAGKLIKASTFKALHRA